MFDESNSKNSFASSESELLSNDEQVKCREILKERIREDLDAANYKSYIDHPKTGKQLVVYDLIMIADVFKRQTHFRSREYRAIGGAVGVIALLPELLPNDEVLTPEQIESGDYKPKRLYYQPETHNDAVDSVAIKNARYHVEPWRLINQHHMHAPCLTEEGQVTSEPVVTNLEAEAALTIFHPDKGNGFRNQKDGRLYIYDREKDEHVPFTIAGLRQHGFHLKQFTGEEGSMPNLDGSSFRDRVRTFFPNLVAQGDLQPEKDIREFTIDKGKKSGAAIERIGVSSSGARMFNGVAHYLGRRFIGKDIEIRSLSPELGAIYDTSGPKPILTHTFTIVDRSHPELKMLQTKTGPFHNAGAELTKVTPFPVEAVVGERRNDESQLEFDSRFSATQEGLTDVYRNVLPYTPEYLQLLESPVSSEYQGLVETSYWLS